MLRGNDELKLHKGISYDFCLNLWLTKAALYFGAA